MADAQQLRTPPAGRLVLPGLCCTLLLASCEAGPGAPELLWQHEALGLVRGAVVTEQLALPDLEAGAGPLLLEVEQLGADLRVNLRLPDGREIGPVDNGLDRAGSELILFDAPGAGVLEVQVQVGPDAAPSSGYRASLSRLPLSSELDRRRAAGLRALTEAGSHQGAEEDPERIRAASDLLAQAVNLLQGQGLARWSGHARLRLAWLSYSAAYAWDTAEVAALAAAADLREAGEGAGEREARTLLAAVLLEQGELERASALLVELVSERRQLDGRYAALQVRNYLALASMHAGDFGAAVPQLAAAADELRELDETILEAQVRSNLAICYLRLGEHPRAVLELRRGLERLREPEVDVRRARLLRNLGRALAESGDLIEARRSYAEAEVIFRALGDSHGEMDSAEGQAYTYLLVGDLVEARRWLQRVIELAREQGHSNKLMRSTLLLGELERAAGDPAAALAAHRVVAGQDVSELLRAEAELAILRDLILAGDDATAGEQQALVEAMVPPLANPKLDLELALVRAERSLDPGDVALALELAERFGEPAARVRAGYAQATALLAAGDLDAALAAAEGALVEVRAQRAGVPGGRMRWSFSGVQRSSYEQHVALLLDLAAGAPDPDLSQALVARSLEVSDESQALSLAEMLSLGDQGSPGATLAAMRELLVAEDASAIQIMLGEARSHAWVLGPSGLSHRELPSRRAIEARAASLFDALRRPRAGGSAAPEEEPARWLAEVVLAPLLAEVRTERLIVVVDGALHQVPLAMLAHPAGGQVIDHHELVAAPSLTALTRIRAGDVGTGAGLVALVDPEGATPGSDADAVAQLPPLPGTRREAAAIAALWSGSGAATTVLQGADAELTALTAVAEDASVLHLATHGVLDLADPRASGLLVLDEGRRRLLTRDEVLELGLAGRLVVLSACHAAGGTVRDGEGVVGLSWAFLAAGSGSVVAGRWEVDDAATATLMIDFHAALLRGLRPGAALRSAQLALRDAGGRNADPRIWAAMSLYGDPRGFL